MVRTRPVFAQTVTFGRLKKAPETKSFVGTLCQCIVLFWRYKHNKFMKFKGPLNIVNGGKETPSPLSRQHQGRSGGTNKSNRVRGIRYQRALIRVIAHAESAARD